MLCFVCMYVCMYVCIVMYCNGMECNGMQWNGMECNLMYCNVMQCMYVFKFGLSFLMCRSWYHKQDFLTLRYFGTRGDKDRKQWLTENLTQVKFVCVRITHSSTVV